LSAQPLHLSSRDNPLLQRLRKLSQDPGAYRKLGSVWLEGDHLARACLQRGHAVTQAVLTEEAWGDATLRALAERAPRIVIVPRALFKGISGLESPAELGFEVPHAASAPLLAAVDSVLLDRLQDAGNVGSILRSAAALGFRQVLTLKGTAALWSPKVLRAGMGAHFALNLVEGLSLADLDDLQAPLLATSSYAEHEVHRQTLPRPCCWVLGHEGQGVGPELLQRCALTVRIPQPGGEESLNVASAAAICLYESARQRLS
jgi:TrmH family RNA methyltransferase